MTVRLRAQQSYELQPQEVATGVRKVLDGDSIYKRTSERQSATASGIVFYTNVRPDIPLILGTDMYISLEPLGRQTIVMVTVESQPYIFGDAFGFYNRYINTFFDKLSAAIVGGVVRQPVQIEIGAPVFRRTDNVSPLIASGAFLVFCLLLFFVAAGGLGLAHLSFFSWFLLAVIVIPLVAFIRSLLALLRSR